MEEKFNYRFIHLLLNQQGSIYYSNLKDKNFCEKLLSKLEVLEKIKKHKNGTEICERYYIEFEEVNIH